MFSNILNFNPKPKKTGHCCVWASSADGRQQNYLQIVTKILLQLYLKNCYHTPKQLRAKFEIEISIILQLFRQASRQAGGWQAARQAERQADSKAGRQAGRKAGGQKCR
jgi:hypothetical protein